MQLNPEKIQNVIHSVLHRCQVCINAEDGYFEMMIYKFLMMPIRSEISCKYMQSKHNRYSTGYPRTEVEAEEG